VTGDTSKEPDEVKTTQSSVYLEQREQSTRRIRWLSPVPITIGVLLLLLLLVLGWLILRPRSAAEEVEPIVEVEVTPAERLEVREYVEAGGTLNALPGHEASFSAATAGKVTRVLVQVGQHVSAGQALAELDRSVLAAQVRQAQAALQQARFTAAQARAVSGAPSQTIAADQVKQAEATLQTARANQTLAQNNLTRQQRLFDRGIAPRKDVEEAKNQITVTTEAVRQAESALAAARVNAARSVGEARTQASVTAGGVEAAQAALDVARAELSRASIRSPIAGTVTKRTVNDGETVDPATPAFEVIDSTSLDVVANVPAGYFYNPAAFAPPVLGSTVTKPVLGNLGGGSGVMSYPHVTNVDATMAKFIPLFGERRGLRIQVQAYNAFNHTEFNSAGTGLQWDANGIQTSVSAGIFNGTLPARILAFGARLEF